MRLWINTKEEVGSVTSGENDGETICMALCPTVSVSFPLKYSLFLLSSDIN